MPELLRDMHLSYPETLPITAHRQEIVAAIQDHQVVVVAGDTGSGKTTQLPKLCLEAGRGQCGRIGCTQPRRLAAMTVAARVAEEMGEKGGGLVGYKIRFQDRTSRATRVKFMTDGVLLAEIQADRALGGYDTIIIDEAHERSLNIDFLLGYLKRLLPRRPDLKLIITSATIDTEKFAAAFDQAPVIQVAGQLYPVEVRYQEDDPGQAEETYVERAIRAVVELRREGRAGDILVFMPTERDIRETIEGLSETLRRAESSGRRSLPSPVILPLFGRLSPAAQRRIFQPVKGQKIVVATNVAETSLTVPGIRYVVDSGLARVSSYNPRARTWKLPIVPVARANCDQRKGRCGRLGPGICIRLYSEEDYRNRPEFPRPEIQRANLAEVILRMISFKLGEPADFPFLDPPSARAVRDGYALLTELGGLDQQRRLTRLGRLMARLPLDPCIARMIIEARDRNCLREMAVIAAALSIQDPRVRPPEHEAAADAAHARFSHPESDFLFYLNLWDTYHATLAKLKSRSRMRKFCGSHFLSAPRVREWLDIHEQIMSILAREKGFVVNQVPASYEAIHQAILSGNLRNIGLKKEKRLYQGAGGRQLMLFPGSSLWKRPPAWLMAAELVETSNLYARTAAMIQPEWLEALAGPLCRSSYSDPHWEKRRGQVVALEKVTLFGLVVVAGRKVNFGRVDPAAARQIFLQSALVAGELAGDYPFLRHNQKLVASLREMEERLRRRTVMVDEEALYRFYDQRLPAEVWDRQGLNRLLKKERQQDFLFMTRDDLLLASPARTELEQFPPRLELGEISLKLSYRFEPGAEDDGVSVLVPASLVPHLRPEPFEWLVPGLLEEKITLLLKGLPKGVRRLLVPLPRTAAQLLADLRPGEGSLYRQLEGILNDSFRLRVEPSLWRPESLPPHLRFRFCLLDERGRVVKATRSFAELAASGRGAADFRRGRQSFAALAGRWQQRLAVPGDLPEQVPERLPLEDREGAVVGYAFPGLAVRDGEVVLELFRDQEERCARTRQGLQQLYAAQLGRKLSQFRKQFALARQDWPLCQGLGSVEQVNDQLWRFILCEVLDLWPGLVPGREAFVARLQKVRTEGMFRLGRPLADLVRSVLVERQQTLAVINRSAAEGMTGQEQWFAEIRLQLEELVPPGFLTAMSARRLQHLPRYLKALRIRVERARVAPAKDLAKAGRLAPFVQRLRQAGAGSENPPPPSVEKQRLLDEYRQLVEEFKVSLFAQELKTAQPVSVKRLEAKWRELSRL